MKSTGVIRRIDELGRIVVPKEIRNSLGIRNGENIEIFIENDIILLKKHLKTKPLENIINLICLEITKIFNINLIISDRDQIIYSNFDNVLKNDTLNKEIIKLIDERITYNSISEELFIVTEKEVKGFYYFLPIIVNNDSLGCVILVKNSPILDFEQKLCKLIVSIINTKLDIS